MKEDVMKEKVDTMWELAKDDPIWIWLVNYCERKNSSFKNLDMLKVLKAMPKGMAKEFLRRMITSQANPGVSADELKNIPRLAFTQEANHD